MRAIHILLFLLFIISGCSTIEIAKEVSKATNSVKKTIEKISNKQNVYEEENSNIELEKEKQEISVELEKEKQEINVEKKKEEIVIDKQKQITSIQLLNKTLSQLIKELGDPALIRKDGNTKTVRFDSSTCRLFVYFDLVVSESKAEYYELRDRKGALLNKTQNIKKCFQEIQKT